VAILGFRASLRGAAITLLDGYKAANNGVLKQTHRARPMSIFPPCAFVDSISESIEYTPAGAQRTPDVTIRFVRGVFDRADVADETDDLIDGFVDYVVDNRHAAGPNTLVTISSVDDDDGWIPDWVPEEQRRPYYSTTATLSGEGLFGGLV
jgi:phenylpyruvate tautomerase PptA (4-oxalocrotonate tautomerase family)